MALKKKFKAAAATLAIIGGGLGAAMYFTGGQAPGPTGPALSEPATPSGATVQYIDDTLRITRTGNTVTRAPIYDKLEALAKDTGAQASFDGYFAKMRMTWVGTDTNPQSIINIRNPEGKISDLPVEMRYLPLRTVAEETTDFVRKLRARPDFSTQSAKPEHKDAADFISGWRQQSNAILALTGVTTPDSGGTLSAFERDDKTRMMAPLMPNAQGELSQPFKIYMAVAERLSKIDYDPSFLSGMRGVERSMLGGVPPEGLRMHAQRIAEGWTLNYRIMSQSPGFARAVKEIESDMNITNAKQTLDTAYNTLNRTLTGLGAKGVKPLTP